MADTPHLRVAFRFRSYDRRWWEVHGNSNADFGIIASQFPALIPLSLAFRHASVYVSHVRISNPLAPRQAQIFHIANPARVIGSSVPETTSVSAIYEFRGTDLGVKRHIWLRGLREADVRRYPNTGVDNPQGDLPSQVTSYYNFLRTNGYGIPNLYPIDTGDNKRHPINSITVLPLQQVRLNVSEAYVLGARKRIVLYKIPQKLFPGLRGRFTVTEVTGGLVPQGFLTPLPVGDYPLVGAAFRKEEFRFSAYLTDGSTFLAFDRRDTQGGPLDTRGHSRALIRRSL